MFKPPFSQEAGGNPWWSGLQWIAHFDMCSRDAIEQQLHKVLSFSIYFPVLTEIVDSTLAYLDSRIMYTIYGKIGLK